MTHHPGDDVLVTFDDQTHPGEIIDISGDWIMCRIHTDPQWDYGSITSRLAPESIVMVRARNIRRTDV